jgi:hypothetical protein
MRFCRMFVLLDITLAIGRESPNAVAPLVSGTSGIIMTDQLTGARRFVSAQDRSYFIREDLKGTYVNRILRKLG